MELISGPPSCWVVTLNSGARIEQWADSFSQSNGFYEFAVLARMDLAERSQVRVVSGRDGRGGAALVAVARIPEAEVLKVESFEPVDDQQSNGS